jgi:hypothetical protein
MVARSPFQVLRDALGSPRAAHEAITALAFDGFVIVPLKPTQAMLDEVCSSEGYEPFTDKTMTEIYSAMIGVFQ